MHLFAAPASTDMLPVVLHKGKGAVPHPDMGDDSKTAAASSLNEGCRDDARNLQDFGPFSPNTLLCSP
jgi:hypothetical protein